MKIIRLFKRPATTVSGVLKQSLTALQKEGRWIQGDWLRTQGDGYIDPDEPLCGGWGACAEGFVGNVVFGIPAYDGIGREQPFVCTNRHRASENASGKQFSLYYKALDVLNEAARGLGHPDVIGLNDNEHTTRADVERMFSKAWRRAQYLERTNDPQVQVAA